MVIDGTVDRRRRLRRARNTAGVLFGATITTVAIGEWPLLMCVVGLHAFIWLFYMLSFTADLHEGRLVVGDDLDLD